MPAIIGETSKSGTIGIARNGSNHSAEPCLAIAIGGHAHRFAPEGYSEDEIHFNTGNYFTTSSNMTPALI